MENQYPSLPQQGKNFAKFAFEVIRKAMSSDALFVSEEVQQERLSICRACEFYDESQGRCKECGCWLEQKTKFALDSCPLDKWVESDESWVNGKFDELVENLDTTEKPKHPKFPIDPIEGQEHEEQGNRWKWNPDTMHWDLLEWNGGIQ